MLPYLFEPDFAELKSLGWIISVNKFLVSPHESQDVTSRAICKLHVKVKSVASRNVKVSVCVCVGESAYAGCVCVCV